MLRDYTFKITTTFSTGKWVNSCPWNHYKSLHVFSFCIPWSHWYILLACYISGLGKWEFHWTKLWENCWWNGNQASSTNMMANHREYFGIFFRGLINDMSTGSVPQVPLITKHQSPPPKEKCWVISDPKTLPIFLDLMQHHFQGNFSPLLWIA